jgi:hypothetical protein
LLDQLISEISLAPDRYAASHVELG